MLNSRSNSDNEFISQWFKWINFSKNYSTCADNMCCNFGSGNSKCMEGYNNLLNIQELSELILYVGKVRKSRTEKNLTFCF